MSIFFYFFYRTGRRYLRTTMACDSRPTKSTCASNRVFNKKMSNKTQKTFTAVSGFACDRTARQSKSTTKCARHTGPVSESITQSIRFTTTFEFIPMEFVLVRFDLYILLLFAVKLRRSQSFSISMPKTTNDDAYRERRRNIFFIFLYSILRIRKRSAFSLNPVEK